MKNTYKGLLAVILVLSVTRSEAQTGDIDFTITGESITVSEKKLDIASTVTKAGNVLTWTQSANGNTDTTVFSIQSTTGSWDTATGLGQLVYNMAMGSYGCTLALSGQAGGISAVLSFVEFNKNQGDYSLNISSFTYQ